MWLPHRFWYDLVHRANLSYEPPLIKLSLGGLLTREMRLQDAAQNSRKVPTTPPCTGLRETKAS